MSYKEKGKKLRQNVVFSLGKAHAHVVKNFHKGKLLSMGIMTLVGILGLMLSVQIISPSTSASEAVAGTIEVTPTTNAETDEPKLDIEVEGNHVFFRFTYEVENAETNCEEGTPSPFDWPDYYSGLDAAPRASGSYPITQRTLEPNQYICLLAIYTDEEGNSESRNYVYYGPYNFVEPTPEPEEQTDEDASVKPSIEVSQETDSDNLINEDLIKVAATVTNHGENTATVTQWHYRILEEETTSADSASCKNKYIEEKELTDKLSFLVNPWVKFEKQMRFDLGDSGKGFYYYNNSLSTNIILYPSEDDYGRWVCVRAANSEEDVYVALALDDLETETSTEQNANTSQQVINNISPQAPSTGGIEESENTPPVSSQSAQNRANERLAEIDEIASPQREASPEEPSEITKTGILSNQSALVQGVGYILMTAAILGVARILVIKKNKKSGLN